MTGLPDCLSAVNDDDVALPLITDAGLVPGYRCGVLSVAGEECRA